MPSSPARHSPVVRSGVVALTLLVAALVPASIAAWSHPKAPSWQRVPATGLATWTRAQTFSDALWIDARSAEDFSRGHVPGALSVPAGDFESHIEDLLAAWSPGRPVVVYCGGGACHASQTVAQRLRTEFGLSDVWVLDGGWSGQTEAAP